MEAAQLLHGVLQQCPVHAVAVGMLCIEVHQELCRCCAVAAALRATLLLLLTALRTSVSWLFGTG